MRERLIPWRMTSLSSIPWCHGALMLRGLFLKDVTRWLEQAKIRFTPSVKLAGKTGYDHMFNFIIPKSQHQPERLLQALSDPT